jgi:hypothetical protein
MAGAIASSPFKGEPPSVAISPATMAASTRSMRRRSGLRSQPSILERRIRLIAGLLRAVRGFGTRSGPGRGHGIGIMAAPEFVSAAMATS